MQLGKVHSVDGLSPSWLEGNATSLLIAVDGRVDGSGWIRIHAVSSASTDMHEIALGHPGPRGRRPTDFDEIALASLRGACCQGA